MDRLRGLILILHLKSQRDGFPTKFAVKKETDMTPTFKGIAAELGKLKHELETRTEELLADVRRVKADVHPTFDSAHAQVTEVRQTLQEVKDFVQEVATTNGPPGSGSESSSEPQKSWAGASEKSD